MYLRRSGGVATSVLTSPLDALRTRLQSDMYQVPLSSTSNGKERRIHTLAACVASTCLLRLSMSSRK